MSDLDLGTVQKVILLWWIKKAPVVYIHARITTHFRLKKKIKNDWNGREDVTSYCGEELWSTLENKRRRSAKQSSAGRLDIWFRLHAAVGSPLEKTPAADSFMEPIDQRKKKKIDLMKFRVWKTQARWRLGIWVTYVQIFIAGVDVEKPMINWHVDYLKIIGLLTCCCLFSLWIGWSHFSRSYYMILF